MGPSRIHDPEGTRYREAFTLLNYIVLNNAKRLARAIILGQRERKRERSARAGIRLTGGAQLILRNLAKRICVRGCGGRDGGVSSFPGDFVRKQLSEEREREEKKEGKKEKEGTTPLASTGDLVG